MKRKRLSKKAKEGDNIYFETKKDLPDLFSTGCQLLDCVLGGGWAEGRIGNIVGDKSSGKTLLAIEACANFINKYPDGKIRYVEAEAAFDLDYAETLGLPVNNLDMNEKIDTVESLFEDLEKTIAETKTFTHTLYIVDSVDALSDRGEMERDMDKGTYGANKAKLLSQLFRRVTRKLRELNITVLLISQVRDNIGSSFGGKTRSGGRALDFYATQILWLSEYRKVKKTSKGITRVIGVEVQALCKKNKVGPPFRDCKFPIMFGYGIDDIVANVEWLGTVIGWDGLDFNKTTFKRVIAALLKHDGEEVQKERKKYSKMVIEKWNELEKVFQPQVRKY